MMRGAAFLLCALLGACGGDAPTPSGPVKPSDTLALKLIYVGVAPSCAPYAGMLPAESIFEDSMRQALPSALKVVRPDGCGADVVKLPSQPPYTIAKLSQIANSVATTRGELKILILDDFCRTDTGEKLLQAGKHFSLYGFVGIFTPQVYFAEKDAGWNAAALWHTIAHETGHALGQVPLGSAHAAMGDAKHCNNRSCLMTPSFGTADIDKLNPDGGNALFDAACVADIKKLQTFKGLWY